MTSPILLDATPSKDIYRSIIADYSLETGICELVDNAVDVWGRGAKTAPLEVDILVDTDQRSFPPACQMALTVSQISTKAAMTSSRENSTTAVQVSAAP